ncbi:MAG: hydrogenase formation protein HypD [Ignisphaera sp.]
MDREQDLTMNFLRAIKSIENIFRSNTVLARALIDKINIFARYLVERSDENTKIKIMNFCGTHEWTVTHFGIRSLVPKLIELVAGPGCPVCVTPSIYIEKAVELALDGVVVYTYGDTYRLRLLKPVKGASSLSEARALGASVKIVTSLVEAVIDSKTHGRDSLFIGIGFETVASGYAKLILNKVLPKNLKFMSLVKLTPPAMIYTIEVHREENPIKGIIAPGHVSTIVGGKAWRYVSDVLGVPVVVSGFEPIDVLASIAEILKQLTRGETRTVIEYTRAVTWEGDKVAQKMIADVYDIVDDVWRGIGIIPKSGLRLKDRFRVYDAFTEYGVEDTGSVVEEHDLVPGCRCGDIVLGRAVPTQCPLFMKSCTPSRPIGPCMVSIEGTCAIWARFGVGGIADDIAKDLGLYI